MTIELQPNHYGAWNNRSVVNISLGRLDEAIADSCRAVALNPKCESAWFNRGLAYEKKGLYQKAISDYSQGLQLEPTNSAGYNQRGIAFANLGQWEKAAADFTLAINNNPKHFIFWSNRGNAYLKLGRLDQSISDLSQALILNSKYAASWINRGIAYTKKELWKKAVYDYSQSLELEPNNPFVCNSLAWLLVTCPDLLVRDAGRAIALAEKAVSTESARGSYWNTLGVARYRAGDCLAACADLEKSMERSNGGDSFDWFFLAMARWQLGDKDRARQLYDRAVEWMVKNHPTDKELLRFRTEAANLLEIEKK